jgi:Fibronectin type III domain
MKQRHRFPMVTLFSIFCALLAACGEDDPAAAANEPTGFGTGSATLSWTPPTQNTDGSPLNNLAGYRIYWGTSAGSYAHSVTVNNPGLATYVVTELAPAQWYFVVTAYSAAGAESGNSNSATKNIQ